MSAECEKKATDVLNQTNDMSKYEQTLKECMEANQTPAPTNAPKPSSTPAKAPSKAPAEVKTSLDAKLTDDANKPDKNWYSHSALIIISLIALYHFGKKLWNKGGLYQLAITVIGALILHDAMHHFFKKGFLYSVKAKLKI